MLLDFIHPLTHSSNVIGEWITPKVTGERPPPCAGFSLTQISETSALFYGGLNPDNGECTPDVYIVEMTRGSVVCYIQYLSVCLFQSNCSYFLHCLSIDIS